MTEALLVNRLAKLFRQEGFLTQKEVGVGYGVADLVLIDTNKVNREHCALRQGYRQYSRLLRDEYFRVLFNLPDIESGQLVDLQTLVARTGLSASLIKYTILKNLRRNGFIDQIDGRFFCKVNGWMPLAKEIIAIEAKLRDWKSGTFQAIRYKTFANKVYLAVPQETEKNVDRSMLKRHNVGLIVLQGGGNDKRVAIQARGAMPQNKFKNGMAIEYFWQRGKLRESATF